MIARAQQETLAREIAYRHPKGGRQVWIGEDAVYVADAV
jgi:hypothetical protein